MAAHCMEEYQATSLEVPNPRVMAGTAIPTMLLSWPVIIGSQPRERRRRVSCAVDLLCPPA